MPTILQTSETNETAWRLDLLLWQIELRHHDFRRHFFTNLYKLYAAVGRICNKMTDLHALGQDEALQELSNELSAQYGKVFEIGQLKQMMLFARQYQPYPAAGGHDLFYFDWDYLAVLLPIDNQQEQHFYMRSAATKQWSVAELQQHIAADDYHNPKKFKFLNKTQDISESIDDKNNLLKSQRSKRKLYKDFRRMPFPNPFIGPALADYERLLQPQPHEPHLSYARFNRGLKADDLNSIALNVIKFREEADREFNSTLNHFLWNMGDLLTLPAGVEDSLSGKLQKLYGDFFDAGLITLIKTYRNCITDRDMEQRLSAILTWRHLILLFPLKNREAQLYYAELAHEHDLSPAELQHRIESNWYEQALVGYNRKHPVVTNSDTSQLKKREKKVEGNQTLVIKYSTINASDLRPYHHNLNILQNPCFMQFMTMPLR
ncbi:DUF1016 N-terminal domain-containing protein [Mucilaginibacter sp. CSA2-8R]|uniref:DUF1016 N-terminal domain-containing protein n=1 Tax=Mucilaginibacter sp. CSA2-8R TaxID=3141542 RepID=UPI00315D6F34